MDFAHDAAAQHFSDAFGRPPVFGVRAPGRVNLIGEHTDHAEGLVLPCAIDRDLRLWAAPRPERRLRARSLDLDETIEAPLPAAVPGGFPSGEALARARTGTFLDYLLGVAFALAERRLALTGLDLLVESEVPRGAGVSSSAALGVAAAAAFDRAGGLGLEPLDWARLAHRSENGFVGLACGILDPFASALCAPGAALRIDCRSQETRSVAMPAGRLAFLLTHSGVTRSLRDGRYDQRVADCRRAVEALRRAGLLEPPARSLRDLPAQHLSRAEALLDPAAAGRARHVVGENARVDAFRRAVEEGDLSAAGALVKESHASLRDHFEVSIPEIDRLCRRADAHPGVYGSRLLGGGFGGCALHLVDPAAAEDVRRDLDRDAARRGEPPREGWRVRPGAGASVVEAGSRGAG